MSSSTKSDPDLATLQEDIASLKRDLESLIEHMKVSAANSAQGAVDQLEMGARRLYSNLAVESERSVAAISRQIEEQPVLALMVALGVGYVGGRFLSR